MFLFRKKCFILVKRDTGYANQRERAATLMWKESGAWRHRSWIKWKRHQHRGVKATNRRRGSQINLAHLKQYGHGVLAISRLLPGESEAGNLSGIRLRRHHWQTMGSWYFKVQPVLIIKKENRFNIVFFSFPTQIISGIEFYLFQEVWKSNEPEGTRVKILHSYGCWCGTEQSVLIC